jgi:hypothetical protein
MLVIESPDSGKFEFEWDGTAYTVPFLSALPMDDLMAFSDSADAGETAALKWAYRFFLDATDGAVASMPGTAFGQLVKAWQTAKPVDVGK